MVHVTKFATTDFQILTLLVFFSPKFGLLRADSLPRIGSKRNIGVCHPNRRPG